MVKAGMICGWRWFIGGGWRGFCRRGCGWSGLGRWGLEGARALLTLLYGEGAGVGTRILELAADGEAKVWGPGEGYQRR